MIWWPWTRIAQLERDNAQLLRAVTLWAEIHERLQVEHSRLVRVLAKRLVQPAEPAPLTEVQLAPEVPKPIRDALRAVKIPEGSSLWYDEIEHARQRLEDVDEETVANEIRKGANVNPWRN